jgi:hypothetical protein
METDKVLAEMLVLNTVLTQLMMAHEDFSVSIHVENFKHLALNFVHDMHK